MWFKSKLSKNFQIQIILAFLKSKKKWKFYNGNKSYTWKMSSLTTTNKTIHAMQLWFNMDYLLCFRYLEALRYSKLPYFKWGWIFIGGDRFILVVSMSLVIVVHVRWPQRLSNTNTVNIKDSTVILNFVPILVFLN